MSLGPILYLVAKYQMSSGPHGPIFIKRNDFQACHHESFSYICTLSAIFYNQNSPYPFFEILASSKMFHFIVGFLGKAFTRHINRFWNYVIKGAIGSFLLVTIFPLICILVCVLCLVAAVTAPMWMPLVTLCVHLFFILIYDFDHPGENLIYV